eukprot:XP_011448186.1 PREDICTED: uncharacterized protein LOC105342831 [Crassostrea gigas]
MAILSRTFILRIFIIALLSLKNPMLCIRAPWLSTWQTFTQNQPSPTVIPHPLNEYPAKVDVQIRVTEGSQQQIFSGIGSCQRDDDDPNPYGGIVYIYNHQEVKLYTPIISNTPSSNQDGVFAYTGGAVFNGPFAGKYATADIRVRVWRMCDFPPANFTSANVHTVSTSGSSYTDIPHNIGYYPDLIVVQLKLPNGFVSEAQGAVFKEQAVYSYNIVCGVIMAYDSSNIRLWPATNGIGSGQYGVFCVSDGWSTTESAYTYSSANVYVQAWKFSISDILFTQTDTRGSGISVSSTITLPQPFNIDNHIFLVQSQAVDGSYINYMFEGAGSALSDGSAFFARIGAVVYSYNQNEINLWYPGAGDYLIFIGGTWGLGAPTQQSTTASVSVKVFKADSTLPGCGCSNCSSNWNTLTTTCVTSPPDDIANAYKFFSYNTTVYTCMPGYQSNGGKSVIAYTGTQWEQTDFNCTGTMVTGWS